MVEDINPDTTAENKDSSKRIRVVSQTKYPLPDNRTDFDTHHLKIISAYATLSPDGSKELKYSDFSETILGFNSQYVSGNNKFLESIGLLSSSGGGKYKPTQDCIDFYKNNKWDSKIDEARKILKKRLAETWFWDATRTLLELKNTISKENLIEHLGHTAEADPKKHNRPLRTIIDYLLYASLINLNEETGEIKLSDSRTIEQPTTEEVIRKPVEKEIVQGKMIKPEMPSTNQINVNISIQFIISPEMSGDDIKEKVKILIESLRTLK